MTPPLGAFTSSGLGGFRASGLGAWAGAADGVVIYAMAQTRLLLGGQWVKYYNKARLQAAIDDAALRSTWVIEIELNPDLDIQWNSGSAFRGSDIWDAAVAQLYDAPATTVPTENITRVSDKLVRLVVTPQVASGDADGFGYTFNPTNPDPSAFPFSDQYIVGSDAPTPGPIRGSDGIGAGGIVGQSLGGNIGGTGGWQFIGDETVSVDGSPTALTDIWLLPIGFTGSPFQGFHNDWLFTFNDSFSTLAGNTVRLYDENSTDGAVLAEFTDITGDWPTMVAGLAASFTAIGSGNSGGRRDGVTATADGMVFRLRGDPGYAPGVASSSFLMRSTPIIFLGSASTSLYLPSSPDDDRVIFAYDPEITNVAWYLNKAPLASAASLRGVMLDSGVENWTDETALDLDYKALGNGLYLGTYWDFDPSSFNNNGLVYLYTGTITDGSELLNIHWDRASNNGG